MQKSNYCAKKSVFIYAPIYGAGRRSRVTGMQILRCGGGAMAVFTEIAAGMAVAYDKAVPCWYSIRRYKWRPLIQ